MRRRRVEVEDAPRLRAETLGVGERHAHTLFERRTTLEAATRPGVTRPVRGGSSRAPSPSGGTAARDAPASAPENDEDVHLGAELMLLLRGGGVEASRAGNPEPPESKDASDDPPRTLPSRRLEPGRHVIVARPPDPPARAASPPPPPRRLALGERAPARIASAGEGYSPLRLPPPGAKKRKRPRRDADEAREERPGERPRERPRERPEDPIRAPNTPAETRAKGKGNEEDANANEEDGIEDADEDARARALAAAATSRPAPATRTPGGRRRGPRSESEYRGVTLYKRTGRFESHIWDNGRQRHIGSFRTARDAAAAHDRVAIKLRGWGAELNFPAKDYAADAGFRRALAENDAEAFVARVRIGQGATRERIVGGVPMSESPTNGAAAAAADGAAAFASGFRGDDVGSSSEDEPSREPTLASRGVVSGMSGTTFARAFRVLQLAAVALLRAQAQAEAAATAARGPAAGTGTGTGTGLGVGPGTRSGMVLEGMRPFRVPASIPIPGTTPPHPPAPSPPPRSPISAGFDLGSPRAMASRAASVAALALESAIAFAPPGDGLVPAGMRPSPGTTMGTPARVSFESRLRRFAEWSEARRRRRAHPHAFSVCAPVGTGGGERTDGGDAANVDSDPNPVRFSPDAVSDAFVSPPAAQLPLARAAPATMPRRPETPSTRSYAPIAPRADELVTTVLARRAPCPTATEPMTATEPTTATGPRCVDGGSPHLVGRPLDPGAGVGVGVDTLPSSARSPTGIPASASEFKRDRSSSAYRGVTMHRRTRRWESHIWDRDSGKQIYLGSFDERDEEAAARAHDLAAVKFGGARRGSLNFPPEEYAAAANTMARMSRDEVIAAVRAGRFGRQARRDDGRDGGL